jgi:hypothetical protein
MSPGCPCDLIALKEDKCYRVEVTTARVSTKGTLNYDRHNPDNFDLLAVVSSQGIHYFPSLEALKL